MDLYSAFIEVPQTQGTTAKISAVSRKFNLINHKSQFIPEYHFYHISYTISENAYKNLKYSLVLAVYAVV